MSHQVSAVQQDRGQRFIPTALERNDMVWCEIIPVTMVAGQIMLIRRKQDGNLPWYEPHHLGAHPSDTVRTHLESFFGCRLNPRSSIVHSTAWRYEHTRTANSRLILTYLVVTTTCAIALDPQLAQPFLLEPISGDQPARSETLIPPERIVPTQVVAHALDHLALLLKTDPAIAHAVGSDWWVALAQRQHQPAGELRV